MSFLEILNQGFKVFRYVEVLNLGFSRIPRILKSRTLNFQESKMQDLKISRFLYPLDVQPSLLKTDIFFENCEYGSIQPRRSVA